MRKIVSYIGIAPKLVGNGSIKYCLWIDEQGKLYVQFVENEASGTFSNFAFSVAEYESSRDKRIPLNPLEGHDVESGKSKIIDDNNNGAFLKAVLRHLFDEKDE